MLRRVIIGYGLLYVIGAVVLLFLVHVSVWLAVYLAVNGLILVSAVLFEQKSYRPRVNRGQGHWQATNERFVDPTTGQLMEVYYNSVTGEREYREVSKQTGVSDG